MTTYDLSMTPDVVIVNPQGFPPRHEALRSSATVVGGIMTIDASRPEAGIRSLITAPDAAAWWLPFVYGDAIADVIADYDGSAGDETVTIEADDAPLTHSATRFLLGLWLQRWIPADAGAGQFPEWLLAVELGTLALDCDPLFLSDRPAAELLSPHLAMLTASVNFHRVNEGTGGINDLVGRVAVDAAAAAVACVGLDHPQLDDLGVALEQYRVLHSETARAARTVSDEKLAAAITEWTVTVRDTVLTRETPRERTGMPGPSPRQGVATYSSTGPLDWAHVHPRSASSASNAVQWTVWQHGDLTGVDIQVDARGASSERRSASRLFARVELAGGTEGIALELQGDAWIGSGVISQPGDDEPVRVTIYEQGVGSPSRVGPSSQEVDLTRAFVLDALRERYEQPTSGKESLRAPFAAELVFRPTTA